jgi:hypothetical protein
MFLSNSEDLRGKFSSFSGPWAAAEDDEQDEVAT